MRRRVIAALCMFLVIAGSIAACGVYPTYGYHYRLSLSFSVDGVERTGSSVIDIRWKGHPNIPDAGPIRSVASRTCDLLPVAARVAEILNPTLDLSDRVGRLALRLTHGIPSGACDLAREAGAALLRGDYTHLAAQNFCEPDRIAAATDGELLGCLGADTKKLAVVREAGKAIAVRRARRVTTATPILQAYVA